MVLDTSGLNFNTEHFSENWPSLSRCQRIGIYSLKLAAVSPIHNNAAKENFRTLLKKSIKIQNIFSILFDLPLPENKKENINYDHNIG